MLNKVIVLQGREVRYTLTYKKIKRLNVKISYDGKVSISAPFGTKTYNIEEVLIKNQNWVLKKLEQGMSEKSKPVVPQERLDISVIYRIFDEAYKRFSSVLKTPPELKIKCMKSMWGNCNRKTYCITLNSELLKTSEYLIEYVIYHEFVHFFHSGHQKDFYDALRVYLPDCESRRTLLNKTRM